MPKKVKYFKISDFIPAEVYQKPFEYLTLFLICIFGAIFYINTKNNIYLYCTVTAYLLWSIYHHYKRHDLQASIILEYIIIALFVVLVATL